MLALLTILVTWLAALSAVALLFRLAMIAYDDIGASGGPGEVIALLTFLLPPVGLAAWAWLRRRSTAAADANDLASDLMLTIGGLVVVAVVFSLT